MDALEEFRAEKDAFFAHSPESPLTVEQKRNFAGLSTSLRTPALRLETSVEMLPGRERVEIQTSTGDVQVYHRHSRFRFQVEDQEAELTIFEGPNGYLPTVCRFPGWKRNLSGRPLLGTRATLAGGLFSG